MSSQNIYCDLVICSDLQSSLPSDLFLAKTKNKFVYTDNFSHERIAQRLRWEKAGIPMKPAVTRHWWELSSEGRVIDDNLDRHVVWLLSHLRAGKFLKNELINQYEFYLSVFWGASNGTGGGPVISCELAEKIVQHGLRMNIGFYVNE